MTLAATKVCKELKLENEELKHLLLKLMSKYKTSEIKRNVLLKRNAMLITDNRNLHKQLLESTKKKIISEKAVTSYQEALKLLQNELKELKAETSSGVTTLNTLSTAKPVVNMAMDKSVQQKEESEQYFEVSDESVRGRRSCSLTSYDSPLQSIAGTYLSDDMTEAAAQRPFTAPQKYEYGMCSDVEAYFQIPEKKSEIHCGELTNDVTNPFTESLPSNETKNEEKDPFAQKRDRLWAQIKELREMTTVTDEELQTRRFAVAAKAEMIQNVHKEIKRMQALISLTK
ncbi:uncharacterized protein [Halyomorpha halys]|uniref:uncharacterized protein n=1 Tax=Halyomorpha halys TaxID=286706 RepID=UPI0006D524BF|nr:uncharacterized protein LOC106678005 [Halyomorpha halys]